MAPGSIRAHVVENMEWLKTWPFKSEDFRSAADTTGIFTSPETSFYSSPSSVASSSSPIIPYIEDTALEAPTRFYGEVFLSSNTPGVALLDIGCSWVEDGLQPGGVPMTDSSPNRSCMSPAERLKMSGNKRRRLLQVDDFGGERIGEAVICNAKRQRVTVMPDPAASALKRGFTLPSFKMKRSRDFEEKGQSDHHSEEGLPRRDASENLMARVGCLSGAAEMGNRPGKYRKMGNEVFFSRLCEVSQRGSFCEVGQQRAETDFLTAQAASASAGSTLIAEGCLGPLVHPESPKDLPVRANNQVPSPTAGPATKGPCALKLLDLPSDCLRVLCSFLGHQGLVSLGEACEELNQLINTDEVWGAFCKRQRWWISLSEVEEWAKSVLSFQVLAQQMERLDALLESWRVWKPENEEGAPLTAADVLTSMHAERLYSLCLTHGSSAALTQLGVWYARGKGLPQHNTKALTLFRMAAEQGYPRAILNLAHCYSRGLGLEIDEAKAASLAHQADAKGDTRAKCLLGGLEEWRMGDSYCDAALQFYLAAAEAGDVRAEATLGFYYLEGEGEDKDIQKAVHYLRLAIFNPRGDGQDGTDGPEHIGMREDKEHSPFSAAHYLGCCYESGQGVSKNMDTAALLFALSAAGGYCLGEAKLGRCYEWRRGVPQDLEEGRRLRRLAESHSEKFPELAEI
eukprot:TRINITY_DN878_c1_g1_i1.p1 TRINITY_DN878_c1_g1~~TRINITY_DN878_c1_g1_i1.p1  ORF type:complete len:684 (+),score=79.28 TRINITY_DN878_c1_g1_i1:126-2177(+)